MSDTASSSALHLEDLRVVRGRRAIQNDITLTFSVGVTILLGANGVGKTSLLEALLFLSPFGGGKIGLNSGLVDRSDLRNYYAQIGYMPQKWAAPLGFTCLEAVQYAAWLKGISSSDSKSRAAAMLARVGLADRVDTKVRKLSGGSQQRVGLAEALVHDPSILILDEPTVGLDPGQRANFRRLVNAHSADRVIILSTHLIDDVESMATRVLILGERGVTFDGSPSELAQLAPANHEASSDIEAAYISIVSRDESRNV